jgi:hypothetical protein
LKDRHKPARKRPGTSFKKRGMQGSFFVRTEGLPAVCEETVSRLLR